MFTIPGIGVHDRPEWAFTIVRNMQQRRIVAKVEQLMALVDELEAQLAVSRRAGEKLLAALVVDLTAGKVPHAAA